MSALIEEFKREHSEIINMLSEVKELGILSHQGQAKLMSVKSCLIEHLKKEDVKLYPALYKEAEHNNSLKNVLDLFAMDMEDVSRVALAFFDKYSRGVLGKELQGEFERLIVALRNRIKNEEDILYLELERMNQPISSISLSSMHAVISSVRSSEI